MKRKVDDGEPAITDGNNEAEVYNDKAKSMVDIVVRIKDDDTFGEFYFMHIKYIYFDTYEPLSF